MNSSVPNKKIHVDFYSGNYIEMKEEERMQQPNTTCWYCDRKVCYLTHKYSPRDKAIRPEEDPYIKDKNPYPN